MNKSSPLRGIEQGRARTAYDYVKQAIEQLGGDDTKRAGEYKSYLKKVPMMIKTNGLGNTFAFVKQKSSSSKPWRLIYDQTVDWLKKDPKKIVEIPNSADLAWFIIGLKSPSYRWLTMEVILLFNWWKRFGDGMIKERK